MTPSRSAGLYLALLAALGIVLIAATAAISKHAGPMTQPRADLSAAQIDTPPIAGKVRAAPAPKEGAPSLVDPAWVKQTAAATGIPATAVRAYGHATLRLGKEQSSCRVGWTTLAAIGWIESQHGTLGERALNSNGHSSTPILGPALDGRNGFAAIRSTPTSAAWHGNPRWDHAVGPMQFIPSTWLKWASDGDEDGISDPNDMDDAAYATARYLCADGHRLDSPDWGRAIFSYNHSNDYVMAVHNAAATYAAKVESGT